MLYCTETQKILLNVGFLFGVFFPPSFTAVAYHLNNPPHPKSQENENSTDASS